MKKIILFLLITTLLVSGCSPYTSEGLPRYFPRMLGRAQIEVPPEYAIIYVRAGAYGDSEYSAAASSAKRMDVVKDLLIKAGVTESEITDEGGSAAYWVESSSAFLSQPVIAVRIDDIENLRKYLDSIVPTYTEIWVDFELTTAGKREANKETLKLAKEDAKKNGFSWKDILFAKHSFDYNKGFLRKYPETYYAASVEQTLEEAQKIDLTSRNVTVSASVYKEEKFALEDLPAIK